jgi:hypothetical protein
VIPILAAGAAVVELQPINAWPSRAVIQRQYDVLDRPPITKYFDGSTVSNTHDFCNKVVDTTDGPTCTFPPIYQKHGSFKQESDDFGTRRHDRSFRLPRN